jgi:hypothetical protein
MCVAFPNIRKFNRSAGTTFNVPPIVEIQLLSYGGKYGSIALVTLYEDSSIRDGGFSS